MRNYRVFFCVIMLFLISFIGFGCGNDDDDDSNDDDDDNMSGGDVASDDDIGDDDDNVPDDDDDSGEPDPLAVIDCDAACLTLGEALGVSGIRSSDPQGLSLEFEIDFGDGTIASSIEADHIYDFPGAYQVVLTATNSNGAMDESSCIVSVEPLPDEVGTLDTAAFQPNYYDDRIVELNNPMPTVGGMIWGFFNAPADATVTDILVNLVSWDDGGSPVEWCEVVPPELIVGEIGIVRCMSSDASIVEGASISLQVESNLGTAWTYQGEIEVSPLAIGYVAGRPDGSELFVYVRNDNPAGVLEITGLKLNGLDVSDYAIVDEPVLDNGRTATIRVPACAGIDWGERLVVAVQFNDENSKQSKETTRELRLFPPKFVVGNWNDDDVFSDSAWRQTQRDAGINLFIWHPSATNPPEIILPLAESEDFYVFSHVGNPYPEYATAAETWAGHSRWYMNAVAGEPEIGSNPPTIALAELQAQIELLGPDLRMWMYNACSYIFGKWGSMSDAGGMDHYCVWAPKCNYNWPFWYWDYIEFAGYYTLAAKRAAEPRPIINWTQALDNTFEIGETQARCNTPDEICSQWYQNIGWGSKALLYYHFLQEHDAACPEKPEQEMGVLARETEQFAELIGIGEMTGNEAFAWSEDPLVDVATTISPDGLVLVVSNLDYDLNLLRPYAWREKTNVAILVDPPTGFEPMRAWSPEHDSEIELDLKYLDDGLYSVLIPSVPVARAVIIEPEP